MHPLRALFEVQSGCLRIRKMSRYVFIRFARTTSSGAMCAAFSMFLHSLVSLEFNCVFHFHTYFVQTFLYARHPVITNIFDVFCAAFVVGLLSAKSASLLKSERHSRHVVWKMSAESSATVKRPWCCCGDQHLNRRGDRFTRAEMEFEPPESRASQRKP